MSKLPTTLGELKASGYAPRSIKEEVRSNLLSQLKSGKQLFTGIEGYEDSVIPQLESALLAKHNVLFLGLRGQAKTKMARLMTGLLDTQIPVIEGSEINDDPLNPISGFAQSLVKEMGDSTPISWINSDERYSEKLATPDVSIADLIGDIDPIKAATQKLTYSDEGAIHYGMIPRANRSIFVINELPDLQARIQVALFNILQEGDVQIRGFNLRLPLDILFVFTANPEDYTNRGSIVTPLKDRIESQILTHYPKSVSLSRKITAQEAKLSGPQKENIKSPEFLNNMLESISFVARESEYVDQKSGVSARLAISAYELLHSAAERRIVVNNEASTLCRLSDLFGVIPAITGKIELVYEGELEGITNVALYLIGKTIRQEFEAYFPDPEKSKKQEGNPYSPIIEWFNQGNIVQLLTSDSQKEYESKLEEVPGLLSLVQKYFPKKNEEWPQLMEFALHGLSEFSQLSRHKLDNGNQFKDIMSGMIDMDLNFDEEEELQ